MGSSSSSEADEDLAAAKNCRDIHQAVGNGNVGAVRHFLRVDPKSLEREDGYGETPLHLAARHGHAAVVELLISAGATKKAVNAEGETPYDLAEQKGHLQVMCLLRPLVFVTLLSGRSCHCDFEESRTVLELKEEAEKKLRVKIKHIIGQNHDPMDESKTLRAARVVPGKTFIAVIAAAAAVADLEADEDLAAAKNCRDIHQAAMEGNVGAVRHFLRVNPELERNGGDGQTPLYQGAAFGHVEVVALLLRCGASMEVKNRNGQTPLLIAVVRGHVEVVALLLRSGASVDVKNEVGETPLHLAARHGHVAVFDQLISAGARVDAVDKDGRTPYDLATGGIGQPLLMGILRPVFVTLLSGRSCHCNSFEKRTVLELKEEAEKKLGVKIKHIIGQDHEPLDESMELAAAHIVPGNTLTAVISEEEIEEAHPEAQAPAQAMPEDTFEMKDFGHGIRLIAQQSIFDGFNPTVDMLEDWCDLKNVSVLEQVLPAGHVPLGRLLRLTPEDRPFPVPVEVQVPTCAGADTVWRSTSAGWEKVETATFEDGRATVTLDHFCDLSITGESIPLKGIGFVHPEGKSAQIVIMHVGCDLCEKVLKRLSSDEDVLQPLRRCGPSVQLGTFQHNEELEINQAGRLSKVRMRFDKMPLSRRLHAQSGLQFDVEIDGENHCFEAPLVPSPPATPAPQPDPHLPSGHPAGSASQAPAVAAARGAVGSSGVPNLGAASQQGHLLLSGRFNRSEIVVYMREVKSQLETRNVPVFMVDASVGQNFGYMTREGLCYAKGMVAFCTSEYGAYTGVGYETFHELQFAHENELPLFPIRLCDQWPPAPQNNDRGTCQNKFVFKKSLVFAEDRQMINAKGVADQIAESVVRLGIFRTKLQL